MGWYFGRWEAALEFPGLLILTPLTSKPLVVLYDGACPICAREIAHYRRRNGAERHWWVDISNHAELESAWGIKPTQALAVFHVRDSHGDWQQGVDAFLVLWEALPAYRWLSRLVLSLRLRGVLESAYALFLRRRGRAGGASCGSGAGQDECQ